MPDAPADAPNEYAEAVAKKSSESNGAANEPPTLRTQSFQVGRHADTAMHRPHARVALAC